MAVYVWQQDLEPGFPLAVIECTAAGDRDRMHWHDHLEIAVVLDVTQVCVVDAVSRGRHASRGAS